jgi:hypothetical protein
MYFSYSGISAHLIQVNIMKNLTIIKIAILASILTLTGCKKSHVIGAVALGGAVIYGINQYQKSADQPVASNGCVDISGKRIVVSSRSENNFQSLSWELRQAQDIAVYTFNDARQKASFEFSTKLDRATGGSKAITPFTSSKCFFDGKNVYKGNDVVINY